MYGVSRSTYTIPWYPISARVSPISLVRGLTFPQPDRPADILLTVQRQLVVQDPIPRLVDRLPVGSVGVAGIHGTELAIPDRQVVLLHVLDLALQDRLVICLLLRRALVDSVLARMRKACGLTVYSSGALGKP